MKKFFLGFFLFVVVCPVFSAGPFGIGESETEKKLRSLIETSGVYAQYRVVSSDEEPVDITFSGKDCVFYLKSDDTETIYDLRSNDRYYIYEKSSTEKNWTRETEEYFDNSVLSGFGSYSEDYDDYDYYYSDYDDYDYSTYSALSSVYSSIFGGSDTDFGSNNDSESGKDFIKNTLMSSLTQYLTAFSSYQNFFETQKTKKTNINFLGRKCTKEIATANYPGYGKVSFESITDNASGICLKFTVSGKSISGSGYWGYECKSFKTPYSPSIPTKYNEY